MAKERRTKANLLRIIKKQEKVIDDAADVIGRQRTTLANWAARIGSGGDLCNKSLMERRIDDAWTLSDNRDKKSRTTIKEKERVIEKQHAEIEDLTDERFRIDLENSKKAKAIKDLGRIIMENVG